MRALPIGVLLLALAAPAAAAQPGAAAAWIALEHAASPRPTGGGARWFLRGSLGAS